MVKFRSEWRDLAGWAPYGVPLTTPSDAAAKLYDATLDQMLYYYNHPHLGGVGETLQRMMAEDPDFIAGNLLRHSFEMFVSNSDPARKRFDRYVQSLDWDSLNDWERGHIQGARFLYREDLVGAMDHYGELCSRYPHDLHSTNLGYVLGLVTGHFHYMRDIPRSIMKHYKPHMPYYGLIHGKLCFGHAEMSEYSQALKCGETALAAFPLDSWAVHAMAHTYENQSQPKQEVEFLNRTIGNWSRGTNFRQHIDWHHANSYIQLGEYETALAIYDKNIAGCALAGDVFPMSDASSFLMRLRIDGQSTGNREEKLGKLWSEQNQDFTSLFYDGHCALAAAMSNDSTTLDTLRDNMSEFIAGDRAGWNKVVTSSYGLQLVDGMRAMCEGDFAGAARHFQSCIPDVVKKIHGSKAQKSIFTLTYVDCAIKSGDRALMSAAQQHLHDMYEWNKVDQLPPLQKRLWDKLAMEFAKE